MIKTELIGVEYGWVMGDLVFEGQIWYGVQDDICTCKRVEFNCDMVCLLHGFNYLKILS